MGNEDLHATSSEADSSTEASSQNGWQDVETLKDDFDPEAAAKAKQEREELIQGSKALAKVGFEQSHRDIVESSFQKARQRKEKLPGKNSERRDLAYLMRLKNMIEAGDERTEPRLWRLSANKLVIDEDNIPESYFEAQEQIMRDAGQGHELTDYERKAIADDVRERQQQSLTEWSNYFGSKDTPYPLWFKIYAWDGMSKMGVFDKEHQKYARRDETTAAPYPGLNQAALAKTFDVLTSGQQGEIPEDDQELAVLIKTSNFAPLYTHFLLEQKTIVPTPERTEDIHGEWVEYLPGQEKELSVAAEGTPWCIASPAMGRNYLGGDDVPENKAKFLLFHLDNPRSGQLSESACASIRLGPDGKVAEISGLEEGQALEDSLVPIVEAKCRELPGGKKFLEAFADKKRLIELDRKMQSGEELSAEDLRFAYEIDRPIHKLDTYNDHDPRIIEIRNAYGIKRAAEIMGVSGGKILRRMKQHDYLDHANVSSNFDELLDSKVDTETLARGIEGENAIENLKKLLRQRNIDIHKIIDKIPGETVDQYFDELLSLGASKDDIARNLDGFNSDDGSRKAIEKLISMGMDINQIVEKMRFDSVGINVDHLLALGADPNLLGKGLHYQKAKYIDKLLAAGADINMLITNICASFVHMSPEEFIERGANPNLLGKAVRTTIDLDYLLDSGADINQLVNNMEESFIYNIFDELLDRGADRKVMSSRLGRWYFRHLKRERRRNQRAARRG